MKRIMILSILATLSPLAGAGDAADDCVNKLTALQEELLATFPVRIEAVEDHQGSDDHRLAGYRKSHGDVVLKGMGLTLVQFEDPDRPQLLFYRPVDGDPRSWLDFEGPDGPYELVGWGYVPAPYPVSPEPPQRECIPTEKWFIHEAGWHLLDGDMRVTPESRLEEPERPEDLESRIDFWHPAAWDIHLWVRKDVPEISVLDPQAGPHGLELPSEAFWFPR